MPAKRFANWSRTDFSGNSGQGLRRTLGKIGKVAMACKVAMAYKAELVRMPAAARRTEAA